MESLVELCDLIAHNPSQFSDKISWICSRCPPADSLLNGSPRVSRSQLHGILAIARFLSKCPNSDNDSPKSLLLAFYRSIPASFNVNFWPQAFSPDAVSSFFNDFLTYISKAAEISPAFASEVAFITGNVVDRAISDNSSVSRVFLKALCSNFPPILASDANKLISVLLDRFDIVVPVSSPREVIAMTPDAASAQSSPLNVNHYQSPGAVASIESSSSRDDATSSRGVVVNGASSISWKSNGDLFGGNAGLVDSSGDKKDVAVFEDVRIESLEKQEMVYKLIGQIVSKGAVDPHIMEQVRGIAKDQLKLMQSFLMVSKSQLKLRFHVHLVGKFA